jgi:hypothetical protein
LFSNILLWNNFETVSKAGASETGGISEDGGRRKLETTPDPATRQGKRNHRTTFEKGGF